MSRNTPRRSFSTTTLSLSSCLQTTASKISMTIDHPLSLPSSISPSSTIPGQACAGTPDVAGGGRVRRWTFDQFETYCRTYLSRRDSLLHLSSSSSTPKETTELSWLTYARGWEWLPSIYPGTKAFEATACLSRTFPLLVRLDQDDEADPILEQALVEEEEETGQSNSPNSHHAEEGKIKEVVYINQSIVYSKTWCLPVLHFTASTTSGTPLSLDQLLFCNIISPNFTTYQQEVSEQVDANGNENWNGGQGGISIGDHPRTNSSSFFLHPCNTNNVLSQLLLLNNNNNNHDNEEQEGEKEEKQDEDWRYIAAFVTMCSTTVEMRSSSSSSS